MSRAQPRLTLLIFAAFAGLVLILEAARAQGCPLWQYSFPPGFAHAVVASVGDVNADTIPDVLAGWEEGQVAVLLSGADGSVISTMNGLAGGIHFGKRVAGVGDLDGDGVGDVVVGAPGYCPFGGPGLYGNGYVQFFSGANGALLFGYGNVNLHHSLAGPGDLNGDGMPDLVIGSGNQVIAYPGPPTVGPEYQVNSVDATLGLNGLVGTSCVAATHTLPVNTSALLALASVHQGMPWGFGVGIAPLIPASGGGFVTFDSQIVNLDLGDPTFRLLWSGSAGPGFTTALTPFVPTVPGSLSAQMVVAAPNKPSGIALSQPIRLIVQ